MYLMHHFYIFVTALFMSLIMVPSIRRWAIDLGAVDQPGGRKVHVGVVPRAGGIAIFVPFLFAILVYFEMNREVRGLLAGGLIVFVTGLIDDLYGLAPRQKFFGQISGALVTALVGRLYLLHLGDLFGLGPITLPLWFAIPFTVFAVVGVVNAINLIDGLDGLAGGVSVIALSSFFLMGLKDGNFSVMAITSSLLGSILGFLRYNAHPARIFMGDTGSLVVGFLLGFTAIILTQNVNTKVSPVVALLVLGVPVADALLVMSKRLIRGGDPFKADKSHVHYRIMDLGLDIKSTVFIVCLFSLGWSLCALAFYDAPEWCLFYFYVLFSILYFFLLDRGFLVRLEFFQKILNRTTLLIFKSSFFSGGKVDSCLSLFLGGVVFLYFVFALMLWGPLERGISLISLVLFFAGVVFYFLGRKRSAFFKLVYFLGIAIVFPLEQVGGQEIVSGLSIDKFTNCLFLLMAILVAILFFSAKYRDRFFDSQLDFLVLAMSLSLAIVSPSLDLNYSVSGVVSKGIVLFLGLKLVTAGRVQVGKCASCSILFILFTMVLRGWIF